MTTNTDLRRRRAGIALACLTLALALNAAALAVADGASALALPALAPAAREVRPTLLLITPRTSPEAPTRANAFAHAEKSTAPPRRPTAVANVPVATAIPAQLARATVAGPEDAALRFFRIGELDEPAEPAAEWNLDIAALDELGLDRVAFELLIGDRGEIIACTLAAPLDLPAEVRQALESRLQQTQMRPAVRDGVRVPSYRRIELFADAGNGPAEPMPLGTRLILSSALSDR